jgi:hypothetical protein
MDNKIMEAWGTHLITFLAGTATGAAGSYFASKYTDKRREKEKKKKTISKFKKIKELMPDLIQEMKEDFNNPDLSSVREFVVLPNNRVLFNSTQKRFAYFEDQHKDLRGNISVLENNEFIFDVTPGNAPIFRITEEFWELVKKS